jgi:hypothetical protein
MSLTQPLRTRLPRPAGIVVLSAVLATAALAPAAAQEESAAPTASPAASVAPLPEGFTRRMVTQIGEVIDSVRPLRQLPHADDVSYRVIDQATFLQELEVLFREEYPAEYLAAEDAALTRMGLLGPDDDLERLILRLYEQQVLAFYDPKTKTFTMIGPMRRIGPTESVVVAHEYGHALQDARWDLEGNRITELDQADAILAQQALIEGDATALMNDWAARELKLRDLLEVSAQALSQQDTRRIGRLPDLLKRQLEFPYIDGFAFVNAIRGQGDWEAVNDVWEAQPVSTEQILHPELYPKERPVEVDLPDIAAMLGEGWAESYEQTMGEMQTHVWVADGKKSFSLFPALPAQLPNAEAAAGWGGDRLVSLDGPDGAWAVVWQTDWDSQQDRNEFRAAARNAVNDLPGAQAIVNADVAGGLSSPVLVLVADGAATLDSLRAALGV